MKTTNFFTEISKYAADADIKLNISMKGDTMTVSFMPEIKGGDKLIPFVATGTVHELDEGLLPEIAKAIETAGGLKTNTAQFAAQVKEMKGKEGKEDDNDDDDDASGADDEKKDEKKETATTAAAPKKRTRGKNKSEATKEAPAATKTTPQVEGVAGDNGDIGVQATASVENPGNDLPEPSESIIPAPEVTNDLTLAASDTEDSPEPVAEQEIPAIYTNDESDELFDTNELL